MKTINTLLVCIVFLLSGCAVKKTSGTILTNTKIFPEINQLTTATLGERMMFSATGWEVDCIIPLVTKERANVSWTYNVKVVANKKYCSKTMNSNQYFGFELGSLVEKIQSDGSSNFHLNGYSAHYVNLDSTEFLRTNDFVLVPNSLQRTIEYMGRQNDIALFVYSELSDNIARPAFNREFQVDLSKGNTLNFKGAEVEIISATNTTIEYKILKHFN